MLVMKVVGTRDLETVEIDFDEIPKYQAEAITRTTLSAIKRFFERPGIRKEYEEWLKEYKKRAL